MSAFAVKVDSDKQTLILAGEASPARRVGADTGRADLGLQLQRVTVLLVEDYVAATLSIDPRAPSTCANGRALLPSAGAVTAPPSYGSASASSSGVAQYSRTQNLSVDRTKSLLIDTYA
jgi:hypothetical protein